MHRVMLAAAVTVIAVFTMGFFAMAAGDGLDDLLSDFVLAVVVLFTT